MPPSADATVVPLAPTATTRLGEANATPCRGELEAVIGVTVAPASVVRRSLSPVATVSRQEDGSLHRIEVRALLAPAAIVFQLFPPSVLRSSVLGPVAYACVGSRKYRRVTVPDSTLATGFQDTPPSVVR